MAFPMPDPSVGLKYVWPTPNAKINNPFGAKQYRHPGNDEPLADSNVGLDLDANPGDPVVAPIGGTVVEVYHALSDRDVEENHGWGGMVLIDGDDGYKHRLSHLAVDSISVEEGSRIEQGQPIGAAGQTGNASGPHVDWEKKSPEGGFEDPAAGQFEKRAKGSPGPASGGGGMAASVGGVVTGLAGKLTRKVTGNQKPPEVMGPPGPIGPEGPPEGHVFEKSDREKENESYLDQIRESLEGKGELEIKYIRHGMDSANPRITITQGGKQIFTGNIVEALGLFVKYKDEDPNVAKQKAKLDDLSYQATELQARLTYAESMGNTQTAEALQSRLDSINNRVQSQTNIVANSDRADNRSIPKGHKRMQTLTIGDNVGQFEYRWNGHDYEPVDPSAVAQWITTVQQENATNRAAQLAVSQGHLAVSQQNAALAASNQNRPQVVGSTTGPKVLIQSVDKDGNVVLKEAVNPAYTPEKQWFERDGKIIGVDKTSGEFTSTDTLSSAERALKDLAAQAEGAAHRYKVEWEQKVKDIQRRLASGEITSVQANNEIQSFEELWNAEARKFRVEEIRYRAEAAEKASGVQYDRETGQPMKDAEGNFILTATEKERRLRGTLDIEKEMLEKEKHASKKTSNMLGAAAFFQGGAPSDPGGLDLNVPQVEGDPNESIGVRMLKKMGMWTDNLGKQLAGLHAPPDAIPVTPLYGGAGAPPGAQTPNFSQPQGATPQPQASASAAPPPATPTPAPPTPAQKPGMPPFGPQNNPGGAPLKQEAIDLKDFGEPGWAQNYMVAPDGKLVSPVGEKYMIGSPSPTGGGWKPGSSWMPAFCP